MLANIIRPKNKTGGVIIEREEAHLFVDDILYLENPKESTETLFE